MNRTTPIRRSPIHRQWVKALELVEAEQHSEILHLSILDSFKEWMFHGNVELPNASEVDWDHVNDPVQDKVRKGFPFCFKGLGFRNWGLGFRV
jgi:hypothetical protein